MIPTPHIAAQKEDIASAVIMPGDPLRSKWIAETFLENPRLVNNIRGIHGYTGKWNGKDVTVMASGMGIPSISIYAYELFNFYGVEKIIRTGTCGSIQKDVAVRDIVIADRALTDSDFMKHFKLPEGYEPAAAKDLTEAAVRIAREVLKEDRTEEKTGDQIAGLAENQCAKLHIGPVLSMEIYYSQEDDLVEYWAGKGALAFEMEAAALYANAEQAGKKALSLFTVSNSILEGSEMDPKERETSFNDMINIALRVATE